MFLESLLLVIFLFHKKSKTKDRCIQFSSYLKLKMEVEMSYECHVAVDVILQCH